MILLDTNVVSGPLEPRPDPTAIRWLDAQSRDDLYLPAIVAAELHYGWSILPAGKRRRIQSDLVHRIIEQFEGRIVDFDLKAAVQFGRIMAAARAAGTPLPLVDGQIAAIASAHAAGVATRNVKHFALAGVAVLDPWGGEL